MTIKEYREEIGMTQAQLAAALGVAQNHISRWERGTVNPSADTLRKMAEIFSCRMDDITPAVKTQGKGYFHPRGLRGGDRRAAPQRTEGPAGVRIQRMAQVPHNHALAGGTHPGGVVGYVQCTADRRNNGAAQSHL